MSHDEQPRYRVNPMGTHRASNLSEHLRRLEEFRREQERRPSNIPNGRAQKRSVNRSLYGVRSGLSAYKRKSVAERTLKVQAMSEELKATLEANATKNQEWKEKLRRLSLDNYPIPTD